MGKPPPGNSLLVKEVFPTIQGEGPFAGMPAVFLRLAGCNLKCWFCDTDFSGGTTMLLSTLLGELAGMEAEIGYIGLGKPLLVITGGEPMAQPIGPLVRSCIDSGWQVQIETDGVLWTELTRDPNLSIVCSPKTPKIHPRVREMVTAWKYLIRCDDEVDPRDGLPISNTQDLAKSFKPLAKPSRGAHVFLQPVEEGDGTDKTYYNTQETVSRVMEFGYRLSLQQHKILGMR